MTKSVDEIEHEVEESRAKLDRTLDRLQSRLNVSDMAKKLGGLRQSSLLNGGAERLMSEARANPMPVLLVCAGFGYLVYDAVRRRHLAALAAAPRAPVLEADLAENRADRLNDRLDAGLEESFPGSDPVSVRITK